MNVSTKPAPGEARCAGRSFADILAESDIPVPDFLAEEHYEYRGSEPLETKRYTDPDFFRAECEKMWPYVWQFAAREEELPNPGDFVVYENAGRSYLIVRQEDDSIRAFHNVCLHRGRKLKLEGGWSNQLQCPFHGFTWNMDGSLKGIPCRWDFGHLTDEKMKLPEAEVARWKGYVFVREISGGPSIEEYIGEVASHYDRWAHEDSVTTIWVGKIVNANWKATMEAFMEAWHTLVTHPQLMPFLGDENTKYDIYGDHANRALSSSGVPSPHLAPLTEQEVADAFMAYNFLEAGLESSAKVKVAEGSTARKALGEQMRKTFAAMTGHDYSHATDSEMLDALVYNIFPNFAPWGGLMPNLVYRFRPWHDHEHTLMEVRFLTRVPKGQERPRSVPMKMLGPDEPWGSTPELATIGEVFDQDMDNLPFVQAGMAVSKTGLVQLGDYQEIRIRQFHQTIDKYMEQHDKKRA